MGEKKLGIKRAVITVPHKGFNSGTQDILE
jgi:hypothetical protein